MIDAGHGGHDPGARVKGLSEADLTLDIALRLEKLLLRQPGVEVVQTRRTNAYVALEERTEIANRSEADLFLSIHANASTDGRARGVETYFLSFAPDAEAEAIAARENAGSTRQMRQLPELLRAIAFNNKLDESRDLARMVQQALYTQARKSDKKARNLGVKQAPFTVLVGAAMPSVLTEISFLTNQQDAGLLATEKYRQQIAEALLAGITRYQQSLKKARQSPPNDTRNCRVRQVGRGGSDPELRMGRFGPAFSAPPFVEHDSASDEDAAGRRGQQEHAGEGENAEDGVDAGVARRRRLLRHLHHDRILLQPQHRQRVLAPAHEGTFSASSTSVRTPTPVAPLG